MNLFIHRAEKIFVIFTFIFFTGVLAFDSLYISPDPASTAPPADNPLYSILSLVQMSIYAVTLLLLLLRWRSSFKAASQNKLVWLLIFLALFSFLWSDFPDLSLRKGINVFLTSLFGLYLSSRFSIREQIKLLAISLGLVAIICFLFSLSFRGTAIEDGANAGSWRGPMTQKNLLSRLMLLSTLTCTFDCFNKLGTKRWYSYISIILSLLLLILSDSKTALIIFALIVCLTPLYSALKWRGTILIPILITFIVVLGSITVLTVGNWENITLAFGKDASLSGRTELWEAAFDKISERPRFGYGFQAFWVKNGGATEIWKLVRYNPPHAHNGYINISLDLGLIGLFLFISNILIAYKNSIQLLRIDKKFIGLFPLVYVTFFSMYNHSENTIIDYNSIFWTIFVALSFSMPRAIKQANWNQD